MKQISKKGFQGKEVSKRDAVFVGLDVHKRSIYVAIRINGKETGTKSVPADWEAVVKVLEPYRKGLKKVVYEAGPTGFGLARRLREVGYPLDYRPEQNTSCSSVGNKIRPVGLPQAGGVRRKGSLAGCGDPNPPGRSGSASGAFEKRDGGTKNQRVKTQMKLTQTGVKSGKFSKEQAQSVRASLRNIRLQEFTFFKQNKSHSLTPDQISQLNQSLDKNSNLLGETPGSSN